MMRRLLSASAVLVCVGVLGACSKPNLTKTAPPQTLSTPDQVMSWVDRTRAQAAAGQAIAPPDQITITASGRMLNLTPSNTIGAVFAAPTDTKNTVAPRANNAVKPAPKDLKYDILQGSPNPSALSAVNNIQKPAMELSQADLGEFKYAGMMRQNDQSIGFLKVESRLFKVRVGELIGKGHWRVSSIDAHHLELQVAGKPVQYEPK